MIEFSAYAACLILVLLMVFQAALIGGAPWGHAAWGGAHRILPVRLKIGSGIGILLYAIFVVFIVAKAGLMDIAINDTVLMVGMWVITGYLALGVLMNAISKSRLERIIMTPTALSLAVLSLIITLG